MSKDEFTEAKLNELMAEVDKVTEHCDEHNTNYIGGCPFCTVYVNKDYINKTEAKARLEQPT